MRKEQKEQNRQLVGLLHYKVKLSRRVRGQLMWVTN